MQPVNRRRFLTGLGAAAGLIAMPEPVRRFWAVSRNAPVGDTVVCSGFSRSEYNGRFTLTDPAAGELWYGCPDATYTVNGKTLTFPIFDGPPAERSITLDGRTYSLPMI